LLSSAQNKFFTHGCQTDSSDDCWKPAAVKDEVVDISFEEPDVDVKGKEDLWLVFYVHVTVHRNKFFCNKTN
jgi:hypothetical protein